MKHPFQKKSFWVALAGLFLIICLFPPVYYASLSGPKGGWEFFFDIESSNSISFGRLILEMMIAFLLNYLGHLIFSKPE